MTDAVTEHGWTAAPRDAEAAKKQATVLSPPKPLTTADLLPLPTSAAIATVDAYAKAHLPRPTYNHSLRVYLYGTAMRQHFPGWQFSNETYLLSCLLHDIGTTAPNLRATRMSFEWFGGILARDLVRDASSGDQDLADAVCEAVIRHQDVGTEGSITAVGQLLQLATIFDNMGGHAELVARDTIESAVAAYPRLGWSRCFHDTIREENALKPWAHTSHLGVEAFPQGVLKNALMAPYDATEL